LILPQTLSDSVPLSSDKGLFALASNRMFPKTPTIVFNDFASNLKRSEPPTLIKLFLYPLTFLFLYVCL
jgi:hypothetical protein